MASSTISTLTALPNAQSHPQISQYRETLKNKYKLSPKKFPQSNESLYKRLLKEKRPTPSINPIVDFYNSISIKYGVTAGAFDLDDLKSKADLPLELRTSAESDTFLALGTPDGEEAIEIPQGELSYAQGTTVLTRHLAWRQAVQGLVTTRTKNVVFVSEILYEGSGAERYALAKNVGEDFSKGLKEYFEAWSTVDIIGSEVKNLSSQI